mmetsp:Transcript_34720/g.40173  ORF Transcript_34720/g.40173 Transcript_34720/m.40173 type:complete len:280 (-) Transcript_34720:453-1292(-)
MFKKRKLTNKRPRTDGDPEDPSQKRQKTEEHGEHSHERAESCSSKKSDDSLDLAKFKKMNKTKGNNKRIVASTIEDKKKKMKAWDEIGSVLKNNGQGYKANRELSSMKQTSEDPNNVDLAQIELNQEVYDRELRRIEISNGIKEGTLDPTVYRGKSGYANYFTLTEENLKKKQFNGTLGPTKQNNYTKTTSRIDYNPELCKDYFETGHCAFGDTCIFIHDRTDYANGHQLEKDWNDKQRKLHRKLMGKKYGIASDDESDQEDNISTKLEEVDNEGLPLK